MRRDADAQPSVVLSCIGKFHIFSLAKELHRNGVLNRFYTGYPRWKLDRDALPFDAIRTHSFLETASLGMRRAISPLGASHPLRNFQRSLAEFSKSEFARFVARDIPRCNVFHGMSQYSLEPGLAARRKYGALFVLDVGSSHVLALKKLLQTECSRLGIVDNFFPDETVEKELEEYRQADVITVPSKFSARTFVENGIAASKVEVNVLGVDLSRFFMDRSEPPEEFTVTFAGALSVRKGLHVLLDAFKRAALPKAKLVLIGTMQPETQSLLEQHAGENVQLLGRLPQAELRAKFSQSSVFVLPSIEDGFGMVILEALASGCPVIATDHTGGPDVIADGKNGYIVPSGDPGALADALVKLYKDRELLRHMRNEAAQQTMKAAGWDVYARGIIDMYKRHRTTMS